MAVVNGLILMFSLTVRAGLPGDWQVGESGTTADLNAIIFGPTGAVAVTNTAIVPAGYRALTWPPGHELLTFPNVSGPYEMMTSANGPHDVLFSDPQRFFVIHSAP